VQPAAPKQRQAYGPHILHKHTLLSL
jgi:hypothetical protein